MKTAPIKVEYIGHFGSDLEVVNAARVSMDKHHEEFEAGDEGLIKYLAKHKHFSPFNHAFLSFRVKAPIFVGRQLVKHKFLPWNEVSRRYVDDEPEFYEPDFWRGRAENVKQGSDESVVVLPFDGHEDSEEAWHPDDGNQHALNLYKYLLLTGVCPEQARMVLPQNTMTEWVWSGTLGAFLDMLVLRLDPHAQYESRIVAQAIAAIVEQYFPVSYKARIND